MIHETRVTQTSDGWFTAHCNRCGQVGGDQEDKHDAEAIANGHKGLEQAQRLQDLREDIDYAEDGLRVAIQRFTYVGQEAKVFGEPHIQMQAEDLAERLREELEAW